MGVITNGSGGGAGGGIRYNAQTDMIQVKVNGQWVDTPYKAYGTFDGMLYNAGVQAVPWDNNGYDYNATTPSVGGATIGASALSFTLTSLYTLSAKCIVTDDTIDMSDWNTLHILYNGGHITCDVSDVNEQCYIVLALWLNSGNEYYLRTFVSRTKNNYGNSSNWIVYENIASGSANVTGNITKVWLE